MSDANNWKTWGSEDMQEVLEGQIVEEQATANGGFAKAESKPLYHNSKVKGAVLLGGASVVGVLGYLLLTIGKPAENNVVATTNPASNPEPSVSNDGWDTAAKQSSAGASSAINIPKDDAKKQTESSSTPTKNDEKKPSTESSPKASTSSAPTSSPAVVQTATNFTAAKGSTPMRVPVAAQTNTTTYTAPTKIPVVNQPPASAKTPVATQATIPTRSVAKVSPYQQPGTQVASVPSKVNQQPLTQVTSAPVKTYQQPFATSQPAKAITNGNEQKLIAAVQHLEKKLAEMDARMTATRIQPLKDVIKIPKSTPVTPLAQVKPEPVQRSFQPVIPVAQTVQKPVTQIVTEPTTAQSILMVDGRVPGKLLDSIKIASGGTNTKTPFVARIYLDQAIKAINGLEIPPQSVVAMNVNVASNGLITGSSFGVWDANGHAIDVPVGALSIESKNGNAPLMAQSIKMSEGDITAANNEAAIWQAAGAGVDGITRQDNTTIVNGTTIATAATGGNRDFLTNALGGLAKSKAKSLEKNAEARQKEAEARAPLWYLAKDTEISVSVRPPAPTTIARYQNQQPLQSGYVPTPPETIDTPKPSNSTPQDDLQQHPQTEGAVTQQYSPSLSKAVNSLKMPTNRNILQRVIP
jgi:hypothetical protein